MTPDSSGQPIETEIDNRRRIKRQKLAEDQAADDGDSKGPAKLRSNSSSESKGKCSE